MTKLVNILFGSLFFLNSTFAEEVALKLENSPLYYPQAWMSSELRSAWNNGYEGEGSTIITVDQFFNANSSAGRLNGTIEYRGHGGWTLLQSSLIAPSANLRWHDYSNSSKAINLTANSLNILNLSFGMIGSSEFKDATIAWPKMHSSIIGHAKTGRAVVAKAAGNDGIAIGGINAAGKIDYLSRDLIGARSVIFVGALNKNGTITSKSSLASYSNYAGTNKIVQTRFITVGVESEKTGLYGTSFATPIISGYAAILGSKFTTATPTQISTQLLSTARRDTILGYRAELHGRGEASISRALSPSSIK